jgi:hypothetical protein
MICQECGMPCEATEYHPYAACLMFKACHNSATVRAGVDSICAHAIHRATDMQAAAPTPSAIEATAALIANGLVGQASEEDVREVERLINELLGAAT